MIWSLLWVIVVGILYLMPGNDLPSVDFWTSIQADKIAHVVLFAATTLFIKVGLTRQRRYSIPRTRSTAYALLFGLSYGSLLEVLQGELAQGRYTEAGDFVANAIGCLLGIVIYRLIYGKRLDL